MCVADARLAQLVARLQNRAAAKPMIPFSVGASDVLTYQETVAAQ